jgi:hypothetical protein
MSVLLETRPGDIVVCIQEFNASPDGQPFSWDTSRRFTVGQRLRLIEGRENPHFKDGPNGWLVVFETPDGARFAAAQTYFATEDCWKALALHFSEQPVRL